MQHDVDVVGLSRATIAQCSVASSNVHVGEVRVQITLAIRPVRGEAGSAVVPALGAPIIRKSGKVTGTPPTAPEVPPKAPPATAAPESAKQS